MTTATKRRPVEVVYTPRATVAEHARHALSGEPHIPAPTGLEFPHRRGSSKCDPDSRKWGFFYRARSEDARERAALEVPEDASEIEYEQAAGEAFARKRGSARWIEREEQCAREFEAREQRRKPKATESFARLRARHRQDAINRGEDVTGAEYLDSRIGRTVARNPEGEDDGVGGGVLGASWGTVAAVAAVATLGLALLTAGDPPPAVRSGSLWSPHRRRAA